jgi:hypothetical protein
MQKQMDNSHGLPLTSGSNDTFDNLATYGIAVYTSTLWLAAIKVATCIATIIGKVENAKEYSELYRTASAWLKDFLWDEKQGYYHYYTTPVLASHIKTDKTPELITSLEVFGVHPDSASDSPGPAELAQLLNRYINDSDTGIIIRFKSELQNYFEYRGKECCSFFSLSKKDIRMLKKTLLILKAGNCFSESFAESIFKDSDDIFCNQLCADFILELFQMEPITPRSEQQRILNKIIVNNFIKHSPTAGASNLVKTDGSVIASFQAQEVWIGIQYTLIASLLLNNMKKEAFMLLDLLYVNLYERIKLPFAVPEGLNSNCYLQINELTEYLKLNENQADELLELLCRKGILDKDHKIIPFEYNYQYFTERLDEPSRVMESIELRKLFDMLYSYSLQYTACQYFRPGMIHSLLWFI